MGEAQESQEQALNQAATAKKKKSSSGLMLIIILAAFVLLIGIVGLNIKTIPGASTTGSKYTILFKNIDLQDASTVVESLNTQGIKDYKITDDGTTILVPKKLKDKIAIKIAGAGLMPSGGSVGYEIFDKGGQLGATDFDKQIKLTRAISGELSRNIKRIDGVEEARVQVVIPQKQLFSTVQNPVQAAVFVKVREDMLLTPEQVRGIVSLVASSVESLKKENITVVDFYGRILSSTEYENDYDRLFAMLQKRKSDLKGSTDKTSPLLEPIAKYDEKSLKNKYSINSIYKSMREATRSKQEKKLMPYVKAGSKAGISAEDQLQNRLKFKEKYEEILEKNVKAIAQQFFPKNSFATKVNIELNNLDFVEKDPNSMISRTTTVLLLDENNKSIDLTPEVEEALFKALTSAVGYVRGRDRIDLRWAPMVSLYSNKNSVGKGLTSFFSNKLTSNDIKLTTKTSKEIKLNFNWLFYAIGIILLVKVTSLLFKKKPAVIPETDSGSASSVFEQKQKQKKAETDNEIGTEIIDQMKTAAGKTPERVAAILEQWFKEDESGSKI